MRIVMTGGGTGGHIYPALAIADRFRDADSSNEILYIGDKNCMESTIVPDHGYEFKDVPAEEVDRHNVLKLFKTGIKNIQGIIQAREIMKDFKPDVVIGTGGFVSFPVIYAGNSLGAKCYFHEQNAFPGLANKMLEKYARKVFLGFESASSFFKQPEKHVVCGNPVRGSFFTADKEEARKTLGISQDDFVILSFGGSLGAKAINDVMFDVMKQVNGEKGMTLLFATGRAYYDDVKRRLEEEDLELKENIVLRPYIDDMETFLAACDLTVCRAGAITLAETGAMGRAAVLVPSPNVTGNHQYYNAKEVCDRGGGVLIEEKDFTFDKMMEQVVKFFNNRDELQAMSERAKAMQEEDTTGIIYSEIMKDVSN